MRLCNQTVLSYVRLINFVSETKYSGSLLPCLKILNLIQARDFHLWLANLDKPKQRYIRLLENALFGFGLSRSGVFHIYRLILNKISTDFIVTFV